MSDLASARAQLQAQSKDGGPSVYEHLAGLLLKIVAEKPREPLKAFEALSVTIKHQRMKQKQQQQAADGAPAPAAAAAAGAVGGIIGIDLPSSPLVSDPAARSAVLAYLQRTQDLLKKPIKLDEDGQPEEEEEIEYNPQAPDLIQQASMLSEAGVALRPFELYRLSLSVQTLCNTTETLQNARFWGKVYGTTQDYYVVEGKVEDGFDDEEEEAQPEEKREPDEGEEEEEEVEPPASRVEPWGIGANEYVYYVSNSVDGPWTRLPKVTPEQIIAARGMRRFFTGRLTSAVFGFPRFPWGEAAYLRTQIARISASTVLAPRGAFLSDEEEPLVALENEEFRGVRASTLLSGDAWQHSRAKLLLEGRVEAFVDENADEEPDDEELEPLEREKRQMERAKKEKPTPILAPASADRATTSTRAAAAAAAAAGGKGGKPAWKFALSHACDTGLRPRAPPGPGVDVDDLPVDPASSHVVASAHSLIWPGAISLAQNKQILHVYVGYGLKQLTGAYKPKGPAAPQQEYRPPTQPNKRGVVVNPIAEQADELPPPPDKDPRTEEEKEQEDQEEKERLERQKAEEGEPIEEVEDEEEEHAKEEDDE